MQLGSDIFLNNQLSILISKVVAVQHLPHGAATTGNNIDTKEIHQKTTAKYGEDLKAELFSNGLFYVFKYCN